MTKESKVPVVANDGTRWEFGIEQAESLIANYGWRLADDSPYIYDKENGIRFKPNKRVDKQAEQA